METIVEKFVLELEAQLARAARGDHAHARGARLPRARRATTRVYGARPLARLIQAEVRDPLTDEILFGRLEHGGTVTIGLDGRRADVRGRAGAGRERDRSRLSAWRSMPVYRLDERLVFPPPEEAEDGLLAVGGDLSPERLVLAYSQGIFPWYERGPADPLALAGPAHGAARARAGTCRRSLREDHAPGALPADARHARSPTSIAACARTPRPGQRTHLDHAGDEARVRRAAPSAGSPTRSRPGTASSWWAGSTASRSAPRSSASRCSRTRRTPRRSPSRRSCAQLERWEIPLVDCQVHTPHLARFGASEWPRAPLPARPARGGQRAHAHGALALRRGPQPVRGASHRPSGVSASQGR